MTIWSTAEIDSFPDSSFAYIMPGGKKDNDNKTVPRSLRKLPYKNDSGEIDLPHVRNALARLSQTDGIPSDEKTKIKNMLENCLEKNKMSTESKMFRVSKIELDNNGDLPNKIMLLQTGNWPNSVKGDFSIETDDLKQIKENFDNGIGFPTEDASTGLAVDFKHEYQAEAGAWIKGLELSIDADGTAKLFATPIEWTSAGAAAVRGGQFKMISPSGYFGRKNKQLSMWPNPQNMKEKIANVLDGAGLTNIPFLRGMSPIRASATNDFDDIIDYDKVIFISTKTNKEPKMVLEDIRVKDKSSLTAEEETFLDSHKSELTAEELTKFGMVSTPKDELSAEDRNLLSAIKAGTKKVIDANESTIEKDRLDRLVATSEQYRTEKAQQVVEMHVKRGAIKQDAIAFWTKQLLDADGQARTDMETAMAGLPSNELLSREIGNAGGVAGSTARDQLSAIASKKVADAAKDGKELLYSDALKQAIRENSALSNQDLIEQKVGA